MGTTEQAFPLRLPKSLPNGDSVYKRPKRNRVLAAIAGDRRFRTGRLMAEFRAYRGLSTRENAARFPLRKYSAAT